MKSKKLFIDAVGLYFILNGCRWYVHGIIGYKYKVNMFQDETVINFKGILENQN